MEKTAKSNHGIVKHVASSDSMPFQWLDKTHVWNITVHSSENASKIRRQTNQCGNWSNPNSHSNKTGFLTKRPFRGVVWGDKEHPKIHCTWWRQASGSTNIQNNISDIILYGIYNYNYTFILEKQLRVYDTGYISYLETNNPEIDEPFEMPFELHLKKNRKQLVGVEFVANFR